MKSYQATYTISNSLEVHGIDVNYHRPDIGILGLMNAATTVLSGCVDPATVSIWLMFDYPYMSIHLQNWH
jgi:hypothetical protein